jgi:lipoate-protein ligase A
MLLRRCWTHRISVAPIGIRARCYSSATNHGITLDQPVQSYISRSSDPYINLSIEHYLLQKSHPESSILFLYVNRPSIILGRNQNPWLEVNLPLLNAAQTHPGTPSRIENEPPGLGDVDLVRRRSGGGTVFHDGGNVNWTVISPAATFTRDKHAEMVTRALRSCGVSRSRVNERHDIVLDQGISEHTGAWGPDHDTHSTPWQSTSIRPLKVSGSAYKLTRARALHHGTALLNSPNLHVIPSYLRSPAKKFIKGRSVDSVSSPVGNILLDNVQFIENVQREFGVLYEGAGKAVGLGDECLDIEEVKKGHAELSVGVAFFDLLFKSFMKVMLTKKQSLDWTYMQTPQFTFSDLPLRPEQKEGEIDYSDAKVCCFPLTHYNTKY